MLTHCEIVGRSRMNRTRSPARLRCFWASTGRQTCRLKGAIENDRCKQAWWYIPRNPTLERQGQEDQEVKASLGHVVRSCLKKKRGGRAGKKASCQDQKLESRFKEGINIRN